MSQDLGKVRIALEGVIDKVGQRDGDAIATALRISQSLMIRREENPDLADLAAVVVNAPPHELSVALGALITHLGQNRPKRHVLVIEDSDVMRTILSETIRREGHEVRDVGTAHEARDLLEEHDFDTVFLDLVLPDADGRNLLLELQLNRSRPRVFVVSSRVDQGIPAECEALGAAGFIPKPAEASRIRAALAESHPASAARQVLRRAAIQEMVQQAEGDRGSIALIQADLEECPAEERTARTLDLAELLLRNLEGVSIGIWSPDEILLVHPDSEPEVLAGSLREVALAKPAAHGLYAGLARLLDGSETSSLVDEASQLLYAPGAKEGDRVVFSPEEAPRRQLTIFIAEDDPVTAKILIHRLEREGFGVVHAPDGLRALELAQSGSFDAALLDIRIPGADGFDILRRLRERSSSAELPILMLTSLGSESDVTRAFELGANDYVLKPFSPWEVLARIRRLVGHEVH